MKLGIVGNGSIVRRMLTDTADIPDLQKNALCVRKESKEKGKTLCDQFCIPALYTDYERFLAKADIDTIYVGISNHVHFSYARKALEAGKHVICEKPFTVTANETRQLADIARQKKLFLWEAFKLPYSPVFQTVKNHLGDIGRLKLIQCNYSRLSGRYLEYAAGQVHPAFDPACGGGCLYDINIYNLHFVTALLGRPSGVRYFSNTGYNGVDTSGAVILSYPDFQAVCTAAKDSSSPCFCVLQGTEGFLRIDGPVSSAKKAELTKNGQSRLLIQYEQNGTLTDEFMEFARQLKDGDFNACYAMLDHSVMMMEILEEAAGQRR